LRFGLLGTGVSPIALKPEARAEGMRFAAHNGGFPQLALRAFGHGCISDCFEARGASRANAVCRSQSRLPSACVSGFQAWVYLRLLRTLGHAVYRRLLRTYRSRPNLNLLRSPKRKLRETACCFQSRSPQRSSSFTGFVAALRAIKSRKLEDRPRPDSRIRLCYAPPHREPLSPRRPRGVVPRQEDIP